MINKKFKQYALLNAIACLLALYTNATTETKTNDTTYTLKVWFPVNSVNFEQLMVKIPYLKDTEITYRNLAIMAFKERYKVKGVKNKEDSEMLEQTLFEIFNIRDGQNIDNYYAYIVKGKHEEYNDHINILNLVDKFKVAPNDEFTILCYPTKDSSDVTDMPLEEFYQYMGKNSTQNTDDLDEKI